MTDAAAATGAQDLCPVLHVASTDFRRARDALANSTLKPCPHHVFLSVLSLRDWVMSGIGGKIPSHAFRKFSMTVMAASLVSPSATISPVGQ